MSILRKVFQYRKNFIAKAKEISIYHTVKNKYKNDLKNIYSQVTLTDEQKKQIDDFYMQNYGETIPYIYHQFAMAFTGKFDVTYFPETLYFAAFNLYMHYDHETNAVLCDKNLLPLFTNMADVKTPRILLSRIRGIFRDCENHILSRQEFEAKMSDLGRAFAKPTLGSLGLGCSVIEMASGKDSISGKSAKEIIDQLGYDFVIQEQLVCHQSLSAIFPKSVNSIRIATYTWKDKILHCPIILRVGQGNNYVDNAYAGGMFIAVEDDGSLHNTAFTELNQKYTAHPDTKFVFKGHVIPQVKQMIDTVIRMHSLFPQVGICHWDLTLDKEGNIVILEANLRQSSYWLIQLAHGKGIFGENTAEILRWTAKMKKMPYGQRKFYRYGYMEKQ